MTTNVEIRGRAFRRVRKNYWFLFLIGLVPMPLSIATYAIRELLPQHLGSVLLMLVTMLMAPLSYGACAIFLKIWHKKKQALSDLFIYMRDWHQFGQVLLLALVNTVLTDLVTTLGRFLPDEMPWMFVRLPFLIVEAWLSVRLLLVPYLYVLQQPTHPLSTIRDSFQWMRGCVWRYIRLSLSMLLLAIIPTLVAAFAIGLMFPLTLPGLNGGRLILLNAAIGFAISFVSSYIDMASAGFADAVIKHANSIGRA